MDQQLKERDEKYTELDSKLNRLHKRAKQRIQDVQKCILLMFLRACSSILLVCIMRHWLRVVYEYICVVLVSYDYVVARSRCESTHSEFLCTCI